MNSGTKYLDLLVGGLHVLQVSNPYHLELDLESEVLSP